MARGESWALYLGFLAYARLRPLELAALTAPPGAKGQGDDLDEFYARFEGIKDFHRQHRNINPRDFINELDELVKGDGMQTIYAEGEDEPIIVDCKHAHVAKRPC